MNIRVSRNFNVDKLFYEFLVSIENKISSMILNLNVTEEINYIKVTDKPDTVSYLPSNKMDIVTKSGLDPYSNDFRVYSKIGRIPSKLFLKNEINHYCTDSDIEQFVNLYKSFFDNSNKKLIVVDGEDIRKYYNQKNYLNHGKSGTLWNSCMRYDERQPLLDLYVYNISQCKMLVLLMDDKVRARALLWEASTFDGKNVKVMDRIYTIFDSDIFAFKKWAKENGYISKFHQNSKSTNIFDIDGKEEYINLSIKPDTHLYKKYPFLDTFQFYNKRTGFFYNTECSDFNYKLVQASGSLERGEPSFNDEDDEEIFDFDFPIIEDENENPLMTIEEARQARRQPSIEEVRQARRQPLVGRLNRRSRTEITSDENENPLMTIEEARQARRQPLNDRDLTQYCR